MPKIQLKDVQKAIKVGKEVLPMVQPYIEQYAPIIIEQVQEKANLAAQNGKKAKLEFLNGIQEKKEAKGLNKAADDNRKKAVNSSLPPITAKAFFENFENNVSSEVDLSDGYMAIAGCYAVVTMKSAREKDPSAYEDVYVGCGKSMGFSIYTQLCGFGNVDVYADFKFKRHMMILLFPCEEKDLESRYEALVRDLQAESSYNKWDVLARSDEAR